MDRGGAGLVVIGAVYGAFVGILLYRRWLELTGRVSRLEDRVFSLEFPPVDGAKPPAGARARKVAAVVVTAPAEG